MFRKMPIKVLALWLDPAQGLHGEIGAVLYDGTPVSLCSWAKWSTGPRDSLRRGWHNNVKRFSRPKTFYYDCTEQELRSGGLSEGMQPPPELQDLVVVG